MKANDLMVGDWVRMKENHGVAFQMEDVGGNGMFKRWTPDGEYMILYSYDEIEPIPLTPEILEKNGFEDMGFYSECKVGDWRVLCDTKNVAILHREHLNIDTPVEYVHELQNALRLCGIEKEIVL